ncbi:MAG: hypothetical protein ACTSRA_11450 [Promethearchaeota archaeon]
MRDNQVLIFDIVGSFGFFKIPEVTRGTISFPFTRTSVIGILAAIIGENRNSYWGEGNPLANLEIALELIKPIKHFGLVINYTHTQTPVNIGSVIKTRIPQSGTHFRGFVTDVRLDLIKDLHYRIYLRNNNEELYQDLKNRIKNSLFEFPPYLGHANLLADIFYIDESKLIECKDEIVEISSVIAVSQLDQKFWDLSNPKISMISNIPIKAITTGNNEEILTVLTDNFVFKSKINDKLRVIVKEDVKVYSVKFSDGVIKNIVFMPS